MSKPLVLVTEHLDDDAFAWLSERADARRLAYDDDRFAATAKRAAGLVIRTYTKITPALLDACPGLKVVARAGVGLDNVDLSACAQRGVRVVHTPDANTRAVVEYVVALLLDATRPRAFVDGPLEPEQWHESRKELKARRQLCQMTLGVLGLGKIGSQVARAARALDMRVIYHDLREIPPEQRFGAVSVSRAELFEQADAVSVHVDGRRSNRGLVNAEDFARAKEDLIFINTSRGLVVSNHALADFMLGHPAACALLDVHEPEPFDATYALLDIENIHLAPHIASSTDLAHANMSWVVRDVVRVLTGQEPEFPAKPEPA
jgi:phosphoglycerate dehydrogenase-like enzyme